MLYRLAKQVAKPSSLIFTLSILQTQTRVPHPRTSWKCKNRWRTLFPPSVRLRPAESNGYTNGSGSSAPTRTLSQLASPHNIPCTYRQTPMPASHRTIPPSTQGKALPFIPLLARTPPGFLELQGGRHPASSKLSPAQTIKKKGERAKKPPPNKSRTDDEICWTPCSSCLHCIARVRARASRLTIASLTHRITSHHFPSLPFPSALGANSREEKKKQMPFDVVSPCPRTVARGSENPLRKRKGPPRDGNSQLPAQSPDTHPVSPSSHSEPM
ncbi:hypothetical protein BS50DRAFT_150196 [Corynespora cassiicola Philippines]|uniref:Uncharacterized protein n=1 Tax=Corynespora cassiicola Philippines TaxID=1448308 RepID=A0A2T2N7J5_CORCC|nr:hypothetical protein BS50DRAFT_150196 [Corynespora cassiicola Philippines]